MDFAKRSSAKTILVFRPSTCTEACRIDAQRVVVGITDEVGMSHDSTADYIQVTLLGLTGELSVPL